LSRYCQVCSLSSVKELLDFGLLPLSNRFGALPHEDDYYHPLIMGQCQSCGLIQLMDSVPANEIKPRVEWLNYSEPEEHLDSIADIISNLENLPDKPIACGITYKDDSLLKRLRERSFGRTWRIQPKKDLGIKEKGIAGETVIPKLNIETVKNLVNIYGEVDVVVARHVLEHALNTKFFLSVILELLKPGGYIIFEVPDCTKQLKNKDYTMPWEEHILYFVPETLKSAFKDLKYEINKYFHYSYKKEDVQLAIIQKTKATEYQNQNPSQELFTLAEEYAKSFDSYKESIFTYLNQYSSKVGKIAFYGAGHDTMILIKSLKIEKFIEFIIDDKKQKQGLYLAGTSLKIRSSKELISEKISLCILCLNIEIQDKVINKHNQFISDGGIFASAYPMQDNSLYKMASESMLI